MTYSSATEIIPNLWVGNLKARMDINFLSSRKISLVINCSHEHTVSKYQYPMKLKNVEYVDLNIPDTGDKYTINILYSKLNPTSRLIDRYLAKGKGILVHCYAGRQRSPTIIASYLMYKCGYTSEYSMAIISAKWDKAYRLPTNNRFSPIYRASLAHYEADLDIKRVKMTQYTN